jgi:hypothetical protein
MKVRFSEQMREMLAVELKVVAKDGGKEYLTVVKSVVSMD